MERDKMIKIVCDVKDSLPIDDLVEFQGDLKVMSDESAAKLKEEILTTGFAFPIYVWKDQLNKNNIIGGHQRVRVLKMLRNEGYVLPKIPVVFIEAASRKEAKRRVLQDTAQYGKITEEGLHEFMTEFDLTFADLTNSFRLPDIDIPHFEANFIAPPGDLNEEYASSLILGNKNETIDISILKPHPRNYRKYPEDQLQHIVSTIKEIGIYKHVIVSSDYTILAGHGLYAAALKLGFKTLPVKKLKYDKDDIRALKILLNDNDLGHLAEIDDRLLSEILKYIKDNAPTGLSGTGYDEKMLAALVMVTRPASEIKDIDEASQWVGMPEYGNTTEPFRVMVACEDEPTRQKFLETIGAKNIRNSGSKLCSIWWPDKEREDKSSIKFVADA